MALRESKIKKKQNFEENGKVYCQNPNCDHMGAPLTIKDFYTSRNPAIPHHPYCKDCVNKMVDVDKIDEVCDILQVLDTPFIMEVWEKTCEKFKQNYLGNYLRYINFTHRNKYENLRYKDSVFTMPEVVEVQQQEEVNNELEIKSTMPLEDVPVWNDEWQGRYSKSDIKYLNDYYKGLNEDFKIVTTNHKDYAKKIAQASLAQSKAYQALLDGEDGAEVQYEKATKIFDTLSKSAQFAESQRGANDVSLGGFGKVFDAVEKHNWIPTYVPEEDDIYDKLLKQFANIEKSI